MDLAALWHPVDDFELARRVEWQGDFTIAPDARHFFVVVRAEGIQTVVGTLVQVPLTFRDVAEWARASDTDDAKQRREALEENARKGFHKVVVDSKTIKRER
jgi:hypothetical protein